MYLQFLTFLQIDMTQVVEMQGARVLATMILTYLNRDNLVLAF